uniref:Uncharacterized protein n=1 Tax=Avena sativa TaxID=4498 RepID=A0ACD5UIT9_AVESA
MTDLGAPMSMKRKGVEVVACHGFAIFLDPKRIKLQDGKIHDVMEEDEPLAHVTAPAIVHDKVNIISGCKSSEPPSESSEDQDTALAPTEVETDTLQLQPCQNAHFFSGFF